MGKRLAKKVLLIGWDAADWKAINPLMDAGYMPNLNNFVNEGVIGNIATLDPPLSPMLWTSVATGKTADKHGILGFIQPDPDNKVMRPVMGSSRRGKAVWNILNQSGLKTHVVGWWPSHPAEPVNGVSVSNFYHRATAPYGEPWPMPPNAVHPEQLTETLAELRVHPGELTGAHILPFIPTAAQIDPKQSKRLASVSKIIADTASVHAAATWIMENEPWDFTAVYYDGIDHFGHGFMRFHPPRMDGVPEDLFNHYNNVVNAGYRFHDMMLGRLLALAGPDTTVILMSDHGFHPDHLRPKGIPKEPAGPAIEHRDLGIFCMRGPHILADERIYGAGLLDIAPTLLTLFGLPVGQDMDGKPLTQAFDHPIEIETIPSWEDVPGEAGMHPEDARRDPWAEQAMMEQMIALGYIEPPGEDAEKAIKKHTRESQFYLARVHLHANRKEEALPLLEKLYRQDPEQRRYALRLAECYRDLGKLAECRQVIEATMAREEAKVKEKVKDKPKARPKSGLPALNLLYGSLLLAEEKPHEALKYLRRVEDADPQRPGLHHRLGLAYLQMKRFQSAETALARALDIDPENAAIWRSLAAVYLNQGRLDDTVEAALTAVGMIYHQPAAHFYLGQALARMGEYEQAAMAFQVSVTQAPGLEQAHLRLAELYENRLNQPEKAKEHRRFAEERIVND